MTTRRKRSVGDVRRGGALRMLTPTRVTRGLEESTDIIPEAVAETVVEEVERYVHDYFPNRRLFIDDLAERANRTFGANEAFRRRISASGNKGRDALYMFMRHWIAADLKRIAPLIYYKLPPSFSMGRSL